MTERYNKDKLVKVESAPARESSLYKLVPEIKFWGFVIQKLGVSMLWRNTSLEELPKNHFIKDGLVYVKSRATLYYEGGIQKNYFFEDEDEAFDFMKGMSEGKNWII